MLLLAFRKKILANRSFNSPRFSPSKILYLTVCYVCGILHCLDSTAADSDHTAKRWTAIDHVHQFVQIASFCCFLCVPFHIC